MVQTGCFLSIFFFFLYKTPNLLSCYSTDPCQVVLQIVHYIEILEID